MHPVRIGTCGWSYDDWKGAFYPESLPSRDFLTAYADHYSVVEVDNTFYRIPSIKMVEGWRDRTPATFGFSLKVTQVITHEKVLVDCEGERDAFLKAVSVLGSRLLCCVLQFGYFNRQKIPSQTAFLDRLDPFLEAWPRDVPLAVEVRNKAWMNEKLATCLRRHGVAWVLPDQAWMPSPLSVVTSLDAVTGPFAYVRLLGDRAEVDKLTPTLDRTVIDRSQQIDDDAEAIWRLSDRVPVLVFVNNHFAGFAPATVKQLQASLARRSS